MSNFICSQCRMLMKCTKTGRLIVFNKTTGGHGDEYACPECETSIVFTNSQPFDITHSLGSVREWADYQKIQGREAEHPLEVKRATGFPLEAQAVVRDLNGLDENELRKILFESEADRSTVKLTDRFTEVEIIHLVEHPKFETFTPEFKEIIWQSVSEIFSRELKRVTTK